MRRSESSQPWSMVRSKSPSKSNKTNQTLMRLLTLTIMLIVTKETLSKSDFSLEVDGDVSSGKFEADCTIIDKVRKVSRRLKMSSEGLDDEQLKVGLKRPEASTANRFRSNTNSKAPIKPLPKVENTGKQIKGTNKSDSISHQTQHQIITKINIQENKTDKNIAQEKHQNKTDPNNQQTIKPQKDKSKSEKSTDDNLLNTTLSNISQSQPSPYPPSSGVIPSSPLLLDSCQYLDLTLLQDTCDPGFAADFHLSSSTLHQVGFCHLMLQNATFCFHNFYLRFLRLKHVGPLATQFVNCWFCHSSCYLLLLHSKLLSSALATQVATSCYCHPSCYLLILTFKLLPPTLATQVAIFCSCHPSCYLLRLPSKLLPPAPATQVATSCSCHPICYLLLLPPKLLPPTFAT